jgi:1-acyl-sn-glycerol-3-phosphate acyltransferase
MLSFLRGARSLFSVVLVGLSFLCGSPVLRLVVVPATWLFPRTRYWLASVFMKGMSAAILRSLALGGARFRRVGRIPTRDGPILIVANHQSQLDICQIGLIVDPHVPGFVTRKRYGRFIPLVSTTVRLLGGPLVDPRRDARGALEEIRRAARELPFGLAIFAEGHRSKDGTIGSFRRGGVETVLTERPMPVYLVLNEGTWRVRRFVDLLFRVHLAQAHTEVLGPFEPPADPADLPAFVEDLRAKLVARLAAVRAAA